VTNIVKVHKTAKQQFEKEVVNKEKRFESRKKRLWKSTAHLREREKQKENTQRVQRARQQQAKGTKSARRRGLVANANARSGLTNQTSKVNKKRV
jgi:hypothetical protein